MLNNTIMNLFSETTKKKNSAQENLFSKIKGDKISLYQGCLKYYLRKKRIPDSKKALCINHLFEKKGNYGNILVVCYL